MCLKRALLAKSKCPYNDGFEHIAFQPDLFDAPPVIDLRTAQKWSAPQNRSRSRRTRYPASWLQRLIDTPGFCTAQASHTLCGCGPDLDPADCYATETIHLHSVSSHRQVHSPSSSEPCAMPQNDLRDLCRVSARLARPHSDRGIGCRTELKNQMGQKLTIGSRLHISDDDGHSAHRHRALLSNSRIPLARRTSHRLLGPRSYSDLRNRWAS